MVEWKLLWLGWLFHSPTYLLKVDFQEYHSASFEIYSSRSSLFWGCAPGVQLLDRRSAGVSVCGLMILPEQWISITVGHCHVDDIWMRFVPCLIVDGSNWAKYFGLWSVFFLLGVIYSYSLSRILLKYIEKIRILLWVLTFIHVAFIPSSCNSAGVGSW